MQRRKPWYSVRPRIVYPPPIEALHRSWLIPQLVNGRGCPEISDCGIQGRDGEGCGPRYGRKEPGPDQERVPGSTPQLGRQPNPTNMLQTGDGSTYQRQGGGSNVLQRGDGSTFQRQGEGSNMLQPGGERSPSNGMTRPDGGGSPSSNNMYSGGSSPSSGMMTPGSSPTSGSSMSSGGSSSATGLVGIKFPSTEEDEGYLYDMTPEALRNYALWWRKRWDAPINCAGYQSDPSYDPFACEIPDQWSEYARAYAKQRGRYDLTQADRSVSMDPQTALKNYLVGVETCMAAGKSWKECARSGSLIALRDEALRNGISDLALDTSLGFLGKPMEKEALQHGVRSACDLHTRGSIDCSAVANSVVSSALSRASWLLTLSGQALENRLVYEAGKDGSFQFVLDPQQLSAVATRTLRMVWKAAVSALNAAWDETRTKVGLPSKPMDFVKPLKEYLLANGWGIINSNPWKYGTSKVWLLGTNIDPMKIDPGMADHASWPWAAAYQNWNQNRIAVRGGLFTLYSLLRIEPLQQALKQGLRDIAVMIVDDQMRSR